MNIVIIGNSHFGSILTKQLNEFDKNNNYKFYNTNEKIFDKIKFVFNILNIDVVYSVSATISGGGALNLALKFNKKIVQHFIGSDVLSAQEDFKNNNINKKLLVKSKYLCEVKWIQEELKEIVPTTIVTIMAYHQTIKPKEFRNFSVLTYMGKGKEKFYGIDDFVFLAKNFPHIEFKIAGIESWSNLPNNLKLLGWIDMIEEIQNSTVYIRNAQHDGLAFSAIEALSLGRYVIRNYKFSHMDYFNTKDELKQIVKKYYENYINGTLQINHEAILFVEREFNQDKVLENLQKEILL